MTCTRLSGRGFKGIVCTAPDFKPGDLPPEGYLAWHEWAEVQRKAGIKQVQCGKCSLWKTPQELSGQTMRWTAQSRKGPVEQIAPVCNKCATPNVEVRGAARGGMLGEKPIDRHPSRLTGWAAP